MAIATPNSGRPSGSGPAVTVNQPVSLPLFHVFSDTSEHRFLSDSRTRKIFYRETKTSFPPESRAPGVYTYTTAVRCSICGRDVTATVGQATVLLLHRSQLSLHGGSYNAKRVFIEFLRRGAIFNLFGILLASLFASLFTHGFEEGSLRLGTLGETVEHWVIIALLFIGCFVLYGFKRLFTCDELLVVIRKPRDFGYGDSACFNLITHAELKPGEHASQLNPPDRMYSDALVEQNYGPHPDRWTLGRRYYRR